ncbi:carbohydrate kinase family protein [Methanolapillus millepedarum]|uniref:Adenosine kinase n=1 Tax=Methanolapillus millepedarum TaxID=3028296 RepID=A0AA96ZV50_9EURY|nr:Adenosine kinase [Methanosarcinaceae archaeon Ac7]
MVKTISVTGHTSLDYLIWVDKIVDKNQSSPITRCETHFGGGAANVSAVMAKLGGSVRLVSPVGDDFVSSEYEKHLSDLGVDLSGVWRMGNEHLSKAFVITDRLLNQSTYFYWGAAGKLREMEPPKVDFVHMVTADCFFNAKMSKAAEFVSFDPGQDLVTYQKEPLQTILKNTNLLFTNRHEIKMVSDISGYSFEELLKMIDVIVVTYDKEGSVLYSGGNVICVGDDIRIGDCTEKIKTPIPCVLAESVDPTGAGDAYKAGFLVAFTKGYPLDVCCKIGAVTASFVVEKVGCQTNLPDWKTMTERYVLHFPASDLNL